MGYRSSVALLLYGNPEQVDMVDNMLTQKLDPEYQQEMFQRVRQVREEPTKIRQDNGDLLETQRKLIMWTWDDIKWYSELTELQEQLFSWVNQINDSRTADDLRDYMCAEFARVGESTDDTQEEYTDHADYLLCVARSIDIPHDFEWIS